MIDETADSRTQFTADDAVQCKLAAARLGYIEDDVLVKIFDENGFKSSARKPPIINRGYFARSYSINKVISRFLSLTNVGNRRQIIVLGSGFDSTALNLRKNAVLDVSVFEVDFEEIIRKKLSMIMKVSTLRGLLFEDTSNTDRPQQQVDSDSSSCSCIHDIKEERHETSKRSTFRFDNLHFIAEDLRDSEKVLDSLRLSGLDCACPTLIITECVLVYLQKEHSESLCKTLSAYLQDACWVSYDMVYPDDTFGKTMLRNITGGGFRIPGFTDYPTLNAQEGRFLNNGWIRSIAVTMLTAYEGLVDPIERNRISRLEIFDEIEEWQLLMNHYALTIAVKGDILTEILSIFANISS